MNFSQYAGVAIVPTLSRLVLAAVFIQAGYTKVFTTSAFEATADGGGPANDLRKLGVSLTAPAPRPVNGAMNFPMDGEWEIVRTSFRQESEPASPPTSPPEPPPTPPAAPTTPATTPPASSTPADSASTALPPGKYYAPTLHHVTLMVAKHEWPMPVLQGWAAAVTELVGGALLLIGLFSRVWGLGLAIVMGVAFYFTSLPVLQSTALSQIGQQEMSTMSIQVALFVLAFGVMLTGPGPLSMDRLLFERSPTPPMPDDKKPH